MGESISKLEIFQQIVQETDLFINLRDALASLKDKLTNDDETNVNIIEKWINELPGNDKNNILGEYEDRQLDGDKLGRDGVSPTKPGQKSKSLIETIENLTVAAEKTPEKEGKSSP
jgi:hypothetical protein